MDPDLEVEPVKRGEAVKKAVKTVKDISRGSAKALSGLIWGLVILALMGAASATLGGIIALIGAAVWVKPSPQPDLRLSHRTTSFGYQLSAPVNILVMGVDSGVESEPSPHSALVFGGRSDTILLLRFQPGKKSLAVLSVPRDTRMVIPGMGTGKINEANPVGGAALTAAALSRNLNHLPIHRYVRLSTGALRELVDLLGGLEVFVPAPMSYSDYTQKLHINLAPGWQTLSGVQAEQFARFRSDRLGDIGRLQRQQLLLKALRQRLTSPALLPQLPALIRMMRSHIDTNLQGEEILALVHFSLQLQAENLKMVLLPGEFGGGRPELDAGYWLMDSVGRDRVLSDYFEIKAPRELPPHPYHRPELSGLKIALQNATDDPKAIASMRQYLERQGWRHLYVVAQKYPLPLRQTQIIAQKGDLHLAQVLQRMLGVGAIEASSVGDLASDLTIVVGRDWPVKAQISPPQ
ncbi:MAG TPA: LCP family protein [Oscillatoriaceae cyanobacterium M33_DOE_052]|uniref:LytR family transcriptional regulator n=1 Tax=Planktothricoides sp. SpSt-374 TaxID=2282167 RepID=A0A7C3ZSM2_9CYAN|nr:LCP family protein [Oscillatoriaceae cyanobacterium M33_DOE_052]